MVKRKSRKKIVKKKPEKEEKVESSPIKPEPTPPIPEAIPEERPIARFSIADFPQKGELLVANCTKITPHGAYFEIVGFEKLGKSAGFVHISELSKTWVRNIRKFIREGQRAVLRVMRVNVDRQEIDLSKRRVNESQRRKTLQSAKQEQRARGIIKSIGKRFKLKPSEIEQQIIEPLEAVGSLYSLLESARDDGVKGLIDTGIDKKIAIDLATSAAKELERPSVNLSAKVTISTYDPAGITAIKSSFDTATKKTLKAKAMSISVSAISAPDYKINLSAEDWKLAEKAWETFQTSFEKTLKKETNQVIEIQFVRE